MRGTALDIHAFPIENCWTLTLRHARDSINQGPGGTLRNTSQANYLLRFMIDRQVYERFAPLSVGIYDLSF